MLSGLKFVADDGAWPLDGSDLESYAAGELSYDIYAHFHILESLAQDEDFQKEYGLYPYNNTANIPGDSGATSWTPWRSSRIAATCTGTARMNATAGTGKTTAGLTT